MNRQLFKYLSVTCQVKNWTSDRILCILRSFIKDNFDREIVMRLMQSIANSRAAFIGAFTAAAFAAGTAATTLTSAPAPAHAQDQVAAATQTANLPGKHVTLRVGPGFNPISADSIARVLRSEGCPATVTAERGFPKSLTVEVGDFSYKFRDGQVGSAGNKALDWCLERS